MVSAVLIWATLTVLQTFYLTVEIYSFVYCASSLFTAQGY